MSRSNNMQKPRSVRAWGPGSRSPVNIQARGAASPAAALAAHPGQTGSNMDEAQPSCGQSPHIAGPSRCLVGARTASASTCCALSAVFGSAPRCRPVSFHHFVSRFSHDLAPDFLTGGTSASIRRILTPISTGFILPHGARKGNRTPVPSLEGWCISRYTTPANGAGHGV